MFDEEYASLDLIPTEVKHLFHEADGKWVLLRSSEIKTPDDVARVQEGLRKEREDHKETKKKLHQFNGLDPNEIHEKLDRFEELEAVAAGKLDDTKINDMVESRIKSRLAPLERQVGTLNQEKEALTNEITAYQTKEKRRAIRDHIRKAGTELKVRSTALEDAMLIGESVFDVLEGGTVVTKEGSDTTPGVDAMEWLTEQKLVRPHWWPESQGVGANGGNGGGGGINNPFTRENWNMTEQGRMVRMDRTKADMMAKAAGTTVGGGIPPAKK
jgi:hypothetical protein